MGTERDTLIEKIKTLKEKRNACILAHNFQPLEVQAAADFIGGTKEIYCEALRREEEVVLVASVYPMAQVVACLVPEKTVLTPEVEAGCPMMRMLDLERVREACRNRPGAEIVTHVKAPFEAIALSSLCVSFSDAPESLKNLENVLFIPDMHIAKNLSFMLGREISSIGGYCPPHAKILPRDLKEKMREYPEAVILAHPECRAEVAAKAHAVLESGDMVQYIKKSDKNSFIVASEVSLVERITEENPHKHLIPASTRAVCQSMKRMSLEKLYWSLEDLVHLVEVDSEYGTRVRDSLRKLFKGRLQMA